ncbi:MAG TPA: hypothetical protein VFI97_09725, partial [Arthrobacter sp.]|nr:hypothetical protein [Arthrobacter sp.]
NSRPPIGRDIIRFHQREIPAIIAIHAPPIVIDLFGHSCGDDNLLVVPAEAVAYRPNLKCKTGITLVARYFRNQTINEILRNRLFH